MNDDKLLNELASRAREQQSEDWVDDALWDRYAAGELSDEELEELISRTPAEEAQKMRAAFEPMELDFTEHLATLATEQLNKKDSGETEHASDDSGRVVSLQSRRRKLVAPLAIAATLVLAIGTWQFGQRAPETSSLPAYELALLGGSEFRSTQNTTDLPVFANGDRLELRLTPATAVKDPVDSRVYVQTSQELLLLEEMNVELAATGAARISGRVGDAVHLTRGSNTLVVIVAQGGELPATRELLRRLEQGSDAGQVIQGSGWQAWRVELAFDATDR